MAVSKVAYGSVPSNEPNSGSPVHTPPKGWGARHSQTLLLFLCLVMGYTIRSQLSVLMVAMVKNGSHDVSNITANKMPISTNITSDSEECIKEQNISSWSVYRTYDWNKATQEMIVFSFFVGYTSMQIPMSFLAQKVGGKIPIIIALAVNGVLSFCTPWIPLVGGWIGVAICRLLQGMTQAAYFPSMHTVLARWIPAAERGRLTAYAYTGSQIGTIIAFQVSGLLAGSPVLGWPSAYWLFGILSLLVCCLFAWLGAATPHEHPRITTEELVFILDDGNADVVPKGADQNDSTPPDGKQSVESKSIRLSEKLSDLEETSDLKRKTPWRAILKSPSVWGNVVSHAGSIAGYLLILTEIPLYMNNILGVDIKRNGLFSSLPYLSMYTMSVIFGNLSDFVRNRKLMKVVNIRRTANTIGLVVSGLFLLVFCYMTNTFIAVSILILSLGLHSGIHVGFVVNQIELTPNFAGSIMALSNMVGNLASLLVPVVVSNIVTDVKDQGQWQIVFFIIVGYQILANTIFVIFAKAEVQPWNFYGDTEQETDEKELSLIEEKKEVKQKGNNDIQTKNAEQDKT